MSYNHHTRTYQGSNTGEEYMKQNFHYVNTARASSPNNISFTGSSGAKKYLIVALAIAVLLLLAAVVIIILFATGVFGTPATEATTPPSPLIPTAAPIQDRFVNRTFLCEVYILKQANAYYDDANNFYTLQAKRIASEGIATVLARTALGSMSLQTELVSLTNSGQDVRLRFRLRIRVPSSSDIDSLVIKNTVLTTRTLTELSTAMNNVAIDTNPSRIIVQLT